MLNAGPFPVFSLVLLFALTSLGLADEKDFLFVFPFLSLSFCSSGWGASFRFGPLSPFFFLELSSFFLHFRCYWLMAIAILVCEGVYDSLGFLKVFLCFMNKGLFPRFGLSDEFCLSLLPLPLPLEVLSSVLLGQESF